MPVANTTMPSMGMDHMDEMSTDHHKSTMKHYFHFSEQATILFAGWKTMTWAGQSFSLYPVKLTKHLIPAI